MNNDSVNESQRNNESQVHQRLSEYTPKKKRKLNDLNKDKANEEKKNSTKKTTTDEQKERNALNNRSYRQRQKLKKNNLAKKTTTDEQKERNASNNRSYRQRQKLKKNNLAKKTTTGEQKERNALNNRSYRQRQKLKKNNLAKKTTTVEEKKRRQSLNSQAYRQRQKLIQKIPTENLAEEQIRIMDEKKEEQRIKNAASHRARYKQIKFNRDIHDNLLNINLLEPGVFPEKLMRKMVSRKSWNQKKNTGTYKSNDVTLILECNNQALSDVQLEYKNKAKEECNQFLKKFNESMNTRSAEIIEQGSFISVHEIDCSPNFPVPVMPSEVSANVAGSSTGLIKPTPTATLLATSQSTVSPLIQNNSVILQSGQVASSASPVFSGQPGTYQLLMGPRMGLIVTPSTHGSQNTVSASTNISTNPVLSPVQRPVTAPRVQVRPGLGNVISTSVKRFPSAPVTTPKITINPATQKNNSSLSKITIAPPPPAPTPAPAPAPSPSLSPSPSSTVNTRSKQKLVTRNVESINNDTSVIQSVKTNLPVPTAVVDLTDDDGKQPSADTREVSINRYPGRIYPSLVVVARPNIKVKEMTSAMITSERTQLDTKVKGILTNSPTKFTEWLIQQGLVRSEQLCLTHVNADKTSIKLKLGMYSDATKFPYSGGYVWISDCCPQKFVSVFCNSIFEGAPHAPTVLLKLMYHWACQTNVHNIISWVKVDNLYIKNFFTNLRAVCTAAICEKFGKLGGLGKKVEVGVISLGTTSQNGSVRQVKVEVLGIMDPVTKYVRLRAVDPVQNAEKNHKLRFSRILESLEHWVHKNTTIVTDFTVDKATLNDLGFQSVIQVQLNSSHAKDSNQVVMEYLKRVVPRMFQNTLSLLSRSIIQQFLDELVWRERWGAISSRAFDNLIIHLAEMTKLDTGDTLINRLKNITSNPFKDWSYKNWKANALTNVYPTKKLPIGGESIDVDSNSNKTVNQKAIRSKPIIQNVVSKSSTPASNKNLTKSNSLITLTIDDSSDNVISVPTIDNLPPSITEIDDDNISVSSNSSRRSQTRNSLSDENRMNGNGVAKQWDSQFTMKSLESFYYGTLKSDILVVSKLRKVDLNMKCFACGLTYNNNILFMKHLAGHAQNEGAFTTDYQCRYCLKNFATEFDLEDHLGSIHLPNKFNSMCLICGDRFGFRGALVNHMQSAHIELELPYQCAVCKYRSSEHTKVVDHFYELHDGGEKVQCPFCLKVVAFESTTKVKLTQNVNFYFNHIKRHQRKPARKCPRCVLMFVNKILLKEHTAKDHLSCVNIPGCIRYQCPDMSTILMPLPSITPPLNRKGKIPPALPVPNFSTFKLDNVLIYPEMLPGKCLECKTEVVASQHFTSFLTCMKCMFASCCKLVMNRHLERFHETKNKRRFGNRKPLLLKNPLYCVCGYTSSCGNAMASHLVLCKRRIAYPNPERAAQYSVQMQSASFPALVNLDDMEQDPNEASDKWLRAFVKNSTVGSTLESDENKSKRAVFSSEKSPPRMLKELGLRRKESSSTDTETNASDKAAEIPEENTN